MTRRGGWASHRLTPLALAVAIDLWLGEPRAGGHPVVGLGKLIALLERLTPPGGAPPDRRRELLAGAAMTVATVGAAALPAWAVSRALRSRWAAVRVAGLALALKPTFAIRALYESVAAVETALLAADPADARSALSRIVGRDVTGLDEALVAAAAIESLTENLSDSVVAPILAYLIGGLPLAYAYRAVNTLDAMLGYRGRYEHLGKAPARLDDLANFLPARLTACLIAVAAPAAGASPLAALVIAGRERHRTASPNAGWPMAAAAAALDRCLEKRGHYRINPAAREAEPGDIARARRLTAAALVMGALVVAGAGLLPELRWRGNVLSRRGGSAGRPPLGAAAPLSPKFGGEKGRRPRGGDSGPSAQARPTERTRGEHSRMPAATTRRSRPLRVEGEVSPPNWGRVAEGREGAFHHRSAERGPTPRRSTEKGPVPTAAPKAGPP